MRRVKFVVSARRPSARGTVAAVIFTGIPIDPEYNLP